MRSVEARSDQSSKSVILSGHLKLPSGDECIREVGGDFQKRLNVHRGYCNVPEWRLRISDHYTYLEPRSPFNWQICLITLAMFLFFSGFSCFLAHVDQSKVNPWAQSGVWGVCVISLTALWCVTSVCYWIERKRGPWLIIDARNSSVTFARFKMTFPLAQLHLLIVAENREHKWQASLGDGSNPAGGMAKYDLDAVITTEDRTLRFSIIGELGGGYAISRGCQRINELHGIPIQRVQRDG